MYLIKGTSIPFKLFLGVPRGAPLFFGKKYFLIFCDFFLDKNCGRWYNGEFSSGRPVATSQAKSPLVWGLGAYFTAVKSRALPTFALVTVPASTICLRIALARCTLIPRLAPTCVAVLPSPSRSRI